MSLRHADLEEVQRIAAEVIELCDTVQRINADRTYSPNHSARISLDVPTMHTAALRRRSLDLTRALARLRNPWRPT